MYTGSKPRPKIELKRDSADYLFEGLAILSCLMSFIGIAYFYDEIPDRIATHYNFAGEPDGWGAKSSLYLLAGTQTGLFLLLFFVAKIPHHFNYLVEITEQNARQQYKTAVKMMRVMNAMICLFFMYLTGQTMANGLGYTTGLGAISVSIFLIVLFGTIFFFISRSISKQ